MQAPKTRGLRCLLFGVLHGDFPGKEIPASELHTTQHFGQEEGVKPLLGAKLHSVLLSAE
ncbi:protein of unknown function [Acidithiobacillus ferrivorans]|uniref:Uncharacterized protein n=1 Tax=Acidithiobacillus ferrivorans TaxID=160808 RepID=A0ABY1MPF3_9PROT|nr:protein of unknown function [Acidithiobacillus ferrivorans]